VTPKNEGPRPSVVIEIAGIVIRKSIKKIKESSIIDVR